MSIQGELNEIYQINQEMKRLNVELKELRKRKKELEKAVSTYIKANELPGIKHNGTAILIDEKVTRAPRSIKDRDMDTLRVLKDSGISNPEEVWSKIQEARKGQEIIVDKLKIKKPIRKN